MTFCVHATTYFSRVLMTLTAMHSDVAYSWSSSNVLKWRIHCSERLFGFISCIKTIFGAFGVLVERHSQLYITTIVLGMLWMFPGSHHLDKLVSCFFGYVTIVVLANQKCGGRLLA
jgi:hypothetical protein